MWFMLLAGVLAMTQRGDPTQAVFKSGVDLVAMSVVVTDAQNRFVPGLSASDFAVHEDGIEQDVSFFAASDVPLDLAVVIDTSASMTDKITRLQHAATGLAATMRVTDRICVVEIKGAVRTLYKKGSDVRAAIDAIRATQPSGATSLFNGLYIMLKELAREGRTGGVRRQAIVVFSDGEDTTSVVTFDDLLDAARRAGVALYTITLKPPKPAHDAPQARDVGSVHRPQIDYAMRALAQETGGRAFFPTTIDELAGIYDGIAAELAHQYVIGYVSNSPPRNGAYRRVMVRVTQPALRAHARSGYVAGRAESAPAVR